ERRADREGAMGMGREEAVDLRRAIAVADPRRRTSEPRELCQPVVTARPARDAARRQVAQLGACSPDGTLLGQHEHEPAAERPLFGSRADSCLQQADRLVETPLLPEELRALREEAVERETAEGLASELERVVHSLLRLGGTPFEEETGHPEPRGVPEMVRLAQLAGQATARRDVRLGAHAVTDLEAVVRTHPLHEAVEVGTCGRRREAIELVDDLATPCETGGVVADLMLLREGLDQ